MARSRRKYGKEKQSSRPSSSIKVDPTPRQHTGTSAGSVQNEGSNVLVLDSKREKLTGLHPKQLPRKAKRLSKKQRKKLQRVIDQKEKKAKRADLLDKLSKVQADSSELALLSSFAHLGTKNSHLQLSKRPLPEDLRQEVLKLNSIRGSKRKKSEKPLKKGKDSSPDTSDVSLSSADEDASPVENVSAQPTEKTEIEDEERDTEPEQKVKTLDFGQHTKTDSKCDKPHTNVSKPDDISDALPAVPTTYVALDRDHEVQEARLKLPILAEEQTIMEAVRHNHTIVLCGETGSGKTTQVPQFLYEAGYAKQGLIGITEPRRVAAISMSQRVAMEMNLPTSKVSYQIRYEGNVTPSTELKFMTDGVLLREVQDDFMLSKYSVVIVDEAHERSVYTDVLIGLLSRIVPLRNKKGKPIRLIIMSATLRVEDFTQNSRLFKKPPPVLRVETRQYPVTVHFNKRTPLEGPGEGRPYIREAYKKLCKVHRSLPSGGVLVFVTGQNEVHSLCKMLRSTFPSVGSAKLQKKDIDMDSQNTEQGEAEGRNHFPHPPCLEKLMHANPPLSALPEVDLEKYSTLPQEAGEESASDESDDRDAPAGFSDEEDLDSDDDILNDSDFAKEVDQSLPMHVLPLYSLLAPSRQRDVFKPPPSSARLCVVATNVAETSLTIPGIKYVIDTGKVKKRVYDKVTGISSFRVTWVSKASADQRAGRAGRVGPGHAYRLYSSAVFQDFDEFSTPEIATRPVPGLVLQMKRLNIERVINFPFPTPPAEESLKAAEDLLVSLGAVEKPKQIKGQRRSLVQSGGRITELGRSMAMFPVHPRFGKMLATASADDHRELLPYVITLVAALTVREVFIEVNEQPASPVESEKHRQMMARLTHMKSVWGGGSNESARAFGDLMVLLGAVGSAEYTGLTPQLCSQNCLRYKALLEIRKLRSQLVNIINSVSPESDLFLNSKMEPPDDLQIKLLRQIVLAAMGDHVARKLPESQIQKSGDAKEVKRLTGAYSCLLTTDPVFVHPSSVLSQRLKLPEYVVFQEMIETKKTYMRGIMQIDQQWLPILCPQYCTLSQPLEDPPPFLNKDLGRVECYANATYGRLSWPLGSVVIPYPSGLERYKWFGRFMMEEYISKALPRQFSLLLSKPEIMTKSWANLQPRTQSLLRALLKEEVDERQKLVDVWKRNKDYLLHEFREWLPDSIRDDVISHWPPELQ